MPTDLMTGLRKLCATLPEAEEYEMHGHPSFRAGKKCFAISSPDQPSLSIKVPLMDQALYCEDPRFSVTHYIGQHGWVTLDLTGGIRWPEVEKLVVMSYRGAALKRMLKELDAR
ncbi:MAG: Phosphoribosylglycinamide formyltransferase [Cyanobacteria bacterium RYN_339]|nr:Phosphoribosylglycinamide formyltransferase [Cyanobacteria bacterium RYN_339]